MQAKRHVLMAALQVASQQYKEDANYYMGRGGEKNDRLFDQFTRQSEECFQLAVEIENSEKIVLVDG